MTNPPLPVEDTDVIERGATEALWLLDEQLVFLGGVLQAIILTGRIEEAGTHCLLSPTSEY
jgi:hypothetical protein